MSFISTIIVRGVSIMIVTSVMSVISVVSVIRDNSVMSVSSVWDSKIRSC